MKILKRHQPIIEFALIDSKLESIEKPIPAIKSLPDWYKKLSPHGQSDKLLLENREVNTTVKRCLPFLEAMGAGYTILNPVEIVVRPNEQSPRMTWLSEYDIISAHHSQQYDGFEAPEGYSKQIFKWNNPWIVKTPPGWSTLFIHPINNTDLPFQSLGGVVDTDSFPLTVNFPFFIQNNFDGIIEIGTPIIQVIPFKRENWKATFSVLDKDAYGKLQFDHNRHAQNYYRHKWWKRKQYT